MEKILQNADSTEFSAATLEISSVLHDISSFAGLGSLFSAVVFPFFMIHQSGTSWIVVWIIETTYQLLDFEVSRCGKKLSFDSADVEDIV